ncbi:MAG TPA: hypothetical protein PLK63_07205 [Catalimonadaceae bacterium]|nr:hypothetical protein [Catalimonadaceae bacterium]
MEINPIYCKRNQNRIAGFSGLTVRCLSIVFCLFLLASISAHGQKKKHDVKDPAQRQVNTAPPKSENKLKTFEEYQEFVIADFRPGTVEDIVQDEESESMQELLQQKLPVNKVFKSTASKVCIIGVDGTANAKMVLGLVNNKTAKVIKKADLEKALSKINVKIITKE